jgi:hypothetical protein
MRKTYLILLFTYSFFVLGCKKPDPNPHLRDPIYLDILSEIAAHQSSIEAEKKQLKEHEKTLREAKPQTGQIKLAEKRVWESKDRLAKMNQMLRYWQSRQVSREIEAKEAYLRAWDAKTPWPDPEEFERYEAQKALSEMGSKEWSAKNRIESYKSSAPAGQNVPRGTH